MSDVAVGSVDAPEQVHHLLLRSAGKVPDDLLCAARRLLADGDLPKVAQALRFATVRDTPPFLMAPVGPDTLTAHGDLVPSVLDLTGDQPGAFGPDDIDLAAIRAVEHLAGSEDGAEPIGMWRAWRYPADGSGWPAPKRIFLIEVDLRATGHQLATVTAEIQSSLAAAGETDPQVEVAREADDLPAYHHLVRAGSALLWAVTPSVPIRIARIVDLVDPRTGPAFTPDHAVVTDPGERERLLRYLRSWPTLLSTPSMLPDLIDSTRPTSVPMHFRTDGRWVWTDSVDYYLQHHGIAPDPDLLAHIKDTIGADHEPWTATDSVNVDSVRVHRALVALHGPTDT